METLIQGLQEMGVESRRQVQAAVGMDRADRGEGEPGSIPASSLGSRVAGGGFHCHRRAWRKWLGNWARQRPGMLVSPGSVVALKQFLFGFHRWVALKLC